MYKGIYRYPTIEVDDREYISRWVVGAKPIFGPYPWVGYLWVKLCTADKVTVNNVRTADVHVSLRTATVDNIQTVNNFQTADIRLSNVRIADMSKY